jgi:hypothetical protein
MRLEQWEDDQSTYSILFCVLRAYKYYLFFTLLTTLHSTLSLKTMCPLSLACKGNVGWFYVFGHPDTTRSHDKA